MSAQPGLTSEQAARALLEYGPNELSLRPSPRLGSILLRQLREPVIVVLLVAAAITAGMADWPDMAVILTVIVLNTVLGGIQEYRSEQALSALGELTAPHATVIRDGRAADLVAREVVPGDLLQVRAGDVIAADGLVLIGLGLAVDEAVLTGESVPRSVSEQQRVHAGTVVVRGRGRVLVTATGHRTELGSIAGSLTAAAVVHTPLQRQLAGLGRWLALAASLAAVAVALLNLAIGHSWETSLVLALSLAVAAIPESLPAVVTLSLALAARRMAAHGVLTRHLAAVEALGSITVLACDKTGTLTEGRMNVAQLWTPAGSGAAETELLEAAALCNDACRGPHQTRAATDDPVEVALVQAARDRGIDVGTLRSQQPRRSEIGFDAEAAMMSTTHQVGTELVTYRKGSPEVLLPSLADPASRVEAERAAERLVAGGKRVLAVLRQDAAGERLLGLVAMTDPARADAADMIAGFRQAGVRPVMITGDHPDTATEIARQVGIVGDARDRTLLPDDVDGGGPAAVYARTRPQHKTAIVNDLRGAGDIVAMTGDGVNDAPALRAADLGVAMGRGTEVAKQAADVVLTTDRLGSMVLGIAEGRRVSDNIRRFLLYGLSGGVAEVLVMLCGPALGIAIPLQAGQILWVNLLTHGLPGVAMGNEAAEPGVLDRGPRPPGQPLITPAVYWRIGVVASVIAALSLVGGLLDTGSAQSAIFLCLILAQLGLAVGLRPVPWRRLADNRMITAAVAINIVLAFAGLYWPPLQDLLRTSAPSTAQLLLAVAAAAVVALVGAGLRQRRQAPPRRGPWRWPRADRSIRRTGTAPAAGRGTDSTGSSGPSVLSNRSDPAEPWSHR